MQEFCLEMPKTAPARENSFRGSRGNHHSQNTVQDSFKKINELEDLLVSHV
jgi:hypothetical protein